MSYDINLTHPVTGKTLELDFPHHMRGGTYQVGGTALCHLNVTYNYSIHYLRVFVCDKKDPEKKGIRTIYGLSGAESIPILQNAIDKLGDDIHDDYWKPTEGNAKAALIQLLTLARMRPGGIWEGD